MTTGERLDQICDDFFSGDAPQTGAFAACWVVLTSDGEIGPDEQDLLSSVASQFGLHDDPFESGLVEAMLEVSRHQKLLREPIEWLVDRTGDRASCKAALKAAVMGALMQGDEITSEHLVLKIADTLGLGARGVLEAAQMLVSEGWGIAVLEHHEVPPVLRESCLLVDGTHWQIAPL
jgi:tellurite resistance protein